ncbi:hypothetical protein FOZ60_017305 [Perkinsus olseni]|uniref:C-CAP/cofactor C-like domain-containing protein n=3 Tax=Perkinsus olseni TaxID=32597 RepID=A0A7J6N1N1_PEROL|nr:hypothetical protein FOZ60_017305 [Perkinsus olseni]
MLWPRGEVFDHATVHTAVRWSVRDVMEFLKGLKKSIPGTAVLRTRFLDYCADPGEHTPHLTQAEALAYWTVFSNINRAVFPTSSGSSNASLKTSASLGDADDWCDIRVLGVLLFLQILPYSRNLRQESFRRGTAAGESWVQALPDGSSNSISMTFEVPCIGFSQQSPRASMVMSSQISVGASSPTSSPPKKEVKVDKVSSEAMDKLGILIAGGPSFGSPCKTLHEAVFALSGASSLRSRISSSPSIAFEKLQGLIESNLVWNEVVYTPTLGTNKSGPINTESPSSCAIGYRSLTLSGLSKTTILRDVARGSSATDLLYISNCSETVIYLTGPIRFAAVVGCVDCDIVVLCCTCQVSVANCERCNIHTITTAIRLESGVDVNLYTLTRNPPVITGDCRGIKLAPFNVLYSGSAALLKTAGMLDLIGTETELPNRHAAGIWAHPTWCPLMPDAGGDRASSASATSNRSSTGSAGSDKQATQGYYLMAPESFNTVSFPEPRSASREGGLDGGETVPKLALPEVYYDALEERRENHAKLCGQLDEIADSARRQQVSELMEGYFREWIANTNRTRQLVDLVRISQEQQEGRDRSNELIRFGQLRRKKSMADDLPNQHRNSNLDTDTVIFASCDAISEILYPRPTSVEHHNPLDRQPVLGHNR